MLFVWLDRRKVLLILLIVTAKLFFLEKATSRNMQLNKLAYSPTLHLFMFIIFPVSFVNLSRVSVLFSVLFTGCQRVLFFVVRSRSSGTQCTCKPVWRIQNRRLCKNKNNLELKDKKTVYPRCQWVQSDFFFSRESFSHNLIFVLLNRPLISVRVNNGLL